MTTFDPTRYGRILVPVLTPFDDDQQVDLGRLRGLIDHLIESGNADSVILTGTTGEFHVQTFDERVAVYEAGVEAAAGRCPVIAGVGCASTTETIALGRRARDLGIDLQMIVAPYYTKPSSAELVQHYQRVAGELGDTRIMLYNIPIFTGVNLAPPMVSELAQIENIVAIKDESELNPKQMTDYLLSTPSDFILYNGDDTMILESYAQAPERVGGVVSGASHLAGRFIRDMIDAFLAGDVTRAGRMQATLYPLLRAMVQGGRSNPAALLKDALRVRGVDAGLPRLPMTPASGAQLDNVRAAVETFLAAAEVGAR